MAELIEIDAWREVFVNALSQLATTVARFLPSLAAALLILAVGWLVSRSVEIAARRGLRGVGLDRAAIRLHVDEWLAGTGVSSTISEAIARLLFWLLMLTFVLSAVETLGLESVTQTIDRLIAFIPNLIGAGLIFVLGLLLARFLGSAVGSAAAAAGVGGARLGFVVQTLGVALVTVIAIQQLGVETGVLVAPLTALLAAAGFAAGLAFALGARPIVTHILAGHFLRQSLPRDVFVEVAGHRGVVQRVGATDTLLRNGDESWSIPNAQLIEHVVHR
jgi:small-conductance mechanosensitive channel